MNWLVISQNIQDERLKTIESYLFSKNEITPFEVFLDGAVDGDSLHENMRHALQSTHCIILDCDKLKDRPDFIFLLGILAGKRIKTYVIGEKSKIEQVACIDTEGQGLFKCFENLSVFMDYLDSAFCEIEKKDYEHNSLIQLFTLGIPFTADSFAHYLEKDVVDIYRLFIHAGMIVNAKTSEGVPMLSVATRSEHMDQVEWLLSLGADINAISGDRGYSAVMDAVWRKNYKITEFLIKKGADLNIVSTDGQPILVLAVGNGNEKIVQLLLDSGADPDLKDSMGMSARQYASLFKKTAIIEILKQFPPKE